MRGFRIAAILAATAAVPLISCQTMPLAAVVPAGNLSIGEHQAHLNGARISYRIAGIWDGRSAPLVYLAGGPGGNSYVFERSAGPLLEPNHLLVYYDQRGTGRSERPASGDYRIATLVDDIEALRVHLGVPKIAVLGHSFGVLLALEYAALYPGNVEAAILSGGLWNAPESCREHGEQLARLHPEAHAAMLSAGQPTDDQWCERVFGALSGEARERFNEANMFPNRATLELLNRMEGESGLRNTGELSRAVFREGLLRWRFSGSERVTAPVLVVGGSLDYAAGPRAQRLLASRLPNARYVEYAGLGHWMFLEDPQRFAADVSRFLQEVQRP